MNIQQICCVLWSNCYSTQSLAPITHHWRFSYTQTVLLAATVLLIFFTSLETEAQKKMQICQVSHQDNNGGSPGKPKTSFSDPAIMITLFWHLIHCNLNTALTNLCIPKVSCKPADITSCFFLGKSFLIFFFLDHEMLWKNCLERYRIIIVSIQIGIFLCLCICVP